MNDGKVPPAPEGFQEPSWATDTMAQKEERFFPDEAALKGQRHKNDMAWLRAYGWVVVVLMWFFSILFIVSVFAWAWHYLMPVSCFWLSEEQLSKIQSVIFSGGLGGVVATVAQRQLAKDAH